MKKKCLMHYEWRLKNENNNNNNQCTKMPITDAVNQQVLSFNVYLIAILYTDTFAFKNAYTRTQRDTHAHAKHYTFIFQTKNIATIPYAKDIEDNTIHIHSTDT